MVGTSPARHRLTTREFQQLGAAGVLAPDARVELIEGEIFDMAPIGSRHAGTVEQLAGLLRATARQVAVRVQQPISLGDYSEPIPDIAVVRERADHYKGAHPRADDVILVVEVADTSLRHDRERKVPLYAAHGVSEVWVVDLGKSEVACFRAPQGGRYSQCETLSAGQLTIEPLPDVRVGLSSLFGS